ncbi:MAG: EpsG family protein [Cetobacterium sp.]|uniref:EpsG family protein n=1 Tax=Cetobacterium sp. TaxID=2071632 RepID=UPI003F3BDB80
MKNISIYIIFILTSLICGLLGFFEDKIIDSFNKKIMTNIFLIVLFVLFAFNRFNEDYIAYLNIFKSEKNVELGYVMLIKLIKFFNGNHHTILFIVGLFLTLILLKNIKKTKYCIWILLFYFLDTFIYDINQIRNLICYLMILIGINFLTQVKKKNYLIMNTIAVLFHRIGIIYYLYFFISNFELKNYKKIIKILFFSGYLMTPIFVVSMLYLFPEKSTVYFNGKIRLGNLMYYILIGFDLFLLNYLKLFTPKDLEGDIYLKFILFPLIFLPYSVLSIELITRIYRNTLLIKWIYIFKNLDNKKLNEKLITIFILFIGAIFPGVILIYKEYEFWERLINSISKIGIY